MTPMLSRTVLTLCVLLAACLLAMWVGAVLTHRPAR